jgi:hypothetical protein
MQYRNDEAFNKKDYTNNMKNIFLDLYDLPEVKKTGKSNKIKNNDLESQKIKKFEKNYTFDDIFIWSLTLYSGKEEDFELIKKYLSLSKNPIACCLAGMIIYKRFKECHYISDKLRENISDKIK